MKYRMGQVVKVKDGVLCPDDPDFVLSGWQGRVIDIDEDDEGPTIGIKWDSLTLNEIPKSYIEKSEEEGVSWAEIYLSDSDIVQSEVSPPGLSHLTFPIGNIKERW